MLEHHELERARPRDPGMGVAIGRRTVFRDGDNEDMFNVARRVAIGNASLAPEHVTEGEVNALRNHIARGGLITSGRHLQHGDPSQPTRNMELFSNCSTAPTSFGKFYLLLNGSGVGRSYDDDLMTVDWRKAPKLKVVLAQDHPDYPKTPEAWYHFGKDFELLPFDMGFTDFTAERMVGVQEWFQLNIDSGAMVQDDEEGVYFRIPDSREGWAQGLELYESMAFEGRSNETLILEFSDVRRKGAAIAGMQDRPASGPLSVMRAFINIRNKVVVAGQHGLKPLMDRPWFQAMHVDHYTSVEVQVGGARRAARMSTKKWTDADILDFVRIKTKQGLWTSNNSVMVDAHFWTLVERARHRKEQGLPVEGEVAQALEVFDAVTECSYFNGEPGFLNGDKLESFRNGAARERPVYENGEGFQSAKYSATWGKELLAEISRKAKDCTFPMTVNPCAEIELHVEGGYCVIGDVAPINEKPDTSNDDWDDRVEEAVRLCVRFLMRVNMMDSLYGKEVERTQRIGVSLTGIHEWAWARFGYSFHDLIEERFSQEFWDLLSRLSHAAKEEAIMYSIHLGVAVPHTVTTIKPAGTTSKLYGLSEGAHLPARAQYLRQVQFTGQRDHAGNWDINTDKVLISYEEKGYPIRQLETFPGMSVVGFPTMPMITRLGLGDLLVTAPQASPEEQYRYLQLLEKHWIGEEMGNQVSYTLKVFTDEHTLEDYRRIVATYQPKVRCCSVMPCKPDREMGYEYLPEEEVTPEQFAAIVAGIDDPALDQMIDLNTLACASGACPI